METKEDSQKILVIRFNSIGDLVLTSPVVSALNEKGHEVHYLVKAAFSELLEPNPYITKVWCLKNSLTAVIDELKKENFDVIIDLHNNYRSKKVCRSLGTKTLRLKKDRLGLWLLTKLGINRITERHIVNRFLDVVSPLGIKTASPSTEFYFSKSTKLEATLPKNYLAIAIAAAWQTKEIPVAKLAQVIEQSQWKEIILLGGPGDKEKAEAISKLISKPVINYTGKLSIGQSALVVKSASALLTGDTGMMHIAAAVGTPIVAVFGSTHPVLGYTPFTQKDNYTLVQNESLGCRPCSKQGQSACPKGHFKCMQELDYSEIIDKVDGYI